MQLRIIVIANSTIETAVCLNVNVEILQKG